MSELVCRSAVRYVQAVTADLAADDLALPSPCAGWTVGDVVAHLADVAAGLAQMLESGVPLAHPVGVVLPTRTCDEPTPIADLHGATDALCAELSEAAGTGRATIAAEAGVVELTAHGWDVGAALDPRCRIPESLATDALAIALPLVPRSGRHPFFADIVNVNENACVSDRFIALLGRAPRPHR